MGWLIGELSSEIGGRMVWRVGGVVEIGLPNVRPPEVRVLLVCGILGLKPQYEPVDRVRVGVSVGGKAHKHACAHVGGPLAYRTEVRLEWRLTVRVRSQE